MHNDIILRTITADLDCITTRVMQYSRDARQWTIYYMRGEVIDFTATLTIPDDRFTTYLDGFFSYGDHMVAGW